MGKNLSTAKKYHIEFTRSYLSGINAQEALYDIFCMFDIEHDANDCYTDKYEIKRSELQRLLDIINGKQDEFKEHAEEFDRAIQMMKINEKQFLHVLNCLIRESDEKNNFVLISWS